MKLAVAQTIVTAVLAHARAQNLRPLAVAVIDARGAPVAFASEDGNALKRGAIAMGKAEGAVAMGMGSRALMARAESQGYFIAAATAAVGGSLVPVPGGVLVKDGTTLLGAVGVSGDTSDNDEAAALAGIAAAGLQGDPG